MMDRINKNKLMNVAAMIAVFASFATHGMDFLSQAAEQASTEHIVQSTQQLQHVLQAQQQYPVMTPEQYIQLQMFYGHMVCQQIRSDLERTEQAIKDNEECQQLVMQKLKQLEQQSVIPAPSSDSLQKQNDEDISEPQAAPHKKRRLESSFTSHQTGNGGQGGENTSEESCIRKIDGEWACTDPACKGRAFERKSGAKRHYLAVHKGEKPFECNTCHKKFAAKATLKRHFITHTSGRPEKCEDYIPYLRKVSGGWKCTGTGLTCYHIFERKNNATRHMRIHTGEKPFECIQCQKQFTEKSTLKRHLVTHTSERPEKCPYPNCKDDFRDKSALNKHIVKCHCENGNPTGMHGENNEEDEDMFLGALINALDQKSE